MAAIGVKYLSLLLTGGSSEEVVFDSREVVRIDTRRVLQFLNSLLCSVLDIAIVYHTPHLYVLGGYSGRYLSECKRCVCAENRWEALPPLPRACGAMGRVKRTRGDTEEC
jgi:hypothetical protein